MCHACSCVYKYQDRIGFLDSLFGLTTHSRFQAIVCQVFQSSSIHQREGEVEEATLAVSAISGDTRLIVDEGQAFADQSIEEGRLSDIRTSHQGQSEGTASLVVSGGFRLAHRNASSWPPSVTSRSVPSTTAG